MVAANIAAIVAWSPNANPASTPALRLYADPPPPCRLRNMAPIDDFAKMFRFTRTAV